jgi:hypothetical protein
LALLRLCDSGLDGFPARGMGANADIARRESQQCSRELPLQPGEILAAFVIPCLTLLGSGVGTRFAKRAVLGNEGHVHLAESIIQRAIVESKEVIGDEAKILHPGNDVEKFRAANHRSEQGDFENDDFGFFQRSRRAGEDLKLGPLDVCFEQIRCLKILFQAELVDSDNGNDARSAVNGGTFDFAE